MVEGYILAYLILVIQIEDDVAVLDGRDIGEVDAGERVVALGAFLFAAGSGNDLAVKHNIDTVRLIAACKEKAVGQVGLCIGDLQVDGLLRTGDHDGLRGILDQVGKRGRGVGQSVGAVADHKAIVLIVEALNGGRDQQPVLWLDIGAVDVDDLRGSHFAEFLYMRHEAQQLFGGHKRL